MAGTFTVRGTVPASRSRDSDQRRKYGVKIAKESPPDGATCPGGTAVITASCDAAEGAAVAVKRRKLNKP